MAPASATSPSQKRSSSELEQDAEARMVRSGRMIVGIPTPPTAHHRSPKRRRLSPSDSNSTSSAHTDTSTPHRYVTPLSSPVAAPQTVRLRLTIPHPAPLDQRKVARRNTAAKSWVCKLQRPFPSHKEIKHAYPLKLMRHYPAEQAPPASNFEKPHIAKSIRVEQLLRKFPLAMPMPPATTVAVNQGVVSTLSSVYELQANRRITDSEEAQKLAWKSFASTEKDRIDRGREALMESGLEMEDLRKEQSGIPNGLPEWRKLLTGKYARNKKLC